MATKKDCAVKLRGIAHRYGVPVDPLNLVYSLEGGRMDFRMRVSALFDSNW